MDIWKDSHDSVSLYDDPTLDIEMFRWDRRPDLNLDVVQHRILTGQITETDIDIAVTLARATLLTEKQLRALYKPKFPQEHKLGTRLRVLQKNGWLDAWRVESSYNKREYLWSIGIAAKNYLGFLLGLKDLPNPIKIASSIDGHLFYPLLNDIRIQLLQKKVLDRNKFLFFPFISPEVEQPHAVFQLDTPAGKMEFIVERLQQKSRPLRFMKRKLSQYRKYHAKHETLPKVFEDSKQTVLVWSVSADEGIRSLVHSFDSFEQDFMQLFIVDEHLHNIRTAWRTAEQEENDVSIDVFDMDFIT
ncbi:hypothetical protein GLW08_20495 [Pontibacillus yanchengensis]|uniref:Uncharacterized protein n=2 Tax=Pontibacillus yanchengensis TaxID=462910 RepID=A0ACC7VLS0_9BACI|nr:hypothetical protein [Pontibacillus yanchengensis]MYL35485.1 hypothetical protein [Pontibacillus yanchengensis]MYL55685.1 hypothetical protein [Pontibacillus yanchengensis]